jgi:malonyl-CoA O-methyltransferase
VVLNKAGIAEGFSGAAGTYNRWADAQRRIADHLAELLPAAKVPNRIFDLGCGTGLLTGALCERYPRADLTGVDLAPGMIAFCREAFGEAENLRFLVEDVEHLAIPDGVDLITSSSTFQWLENPPVLLRRILHALAPGGGLALAVFVEGSLDELYGSASHALPHPITRLSYPASDLWLHTVEEAGFQVQRNETRPIRVWYDHPMDVLRSFKGIGATFRHQEGYLARTPGEIRRLLSVYQELHGDPDGRLPMTYQVQFLIACKP